MTLFQPINFYRNHLIYFQNPNSVVEEFLLTTMHELSSETSHLHRLWIIVFLMCSLSTDCKLVFSIIVLGRDKILRGARCNQLVPKNSWLWLVEKEMEPFGLFSWLKKVNPLANLWLDANNYFILNWIQSWP
jgi:hypothetical protein